MTNIDPQSFTHFLSIKVKYSSIKIILGYSDPICNDAFNLNIIASQIIKIIIKLLYVSQEIYLCFFRELRGFKIDNRLAII